MAVSSQVQPTPTPTPDPSVLKVGYSKANGFNPYLVNDSLVLQISGLVSEKLIEITPEMDIDYRVASSITSSGLSVTIQLRQ